jgi:IS5 family transposase
MIRDRLSFMRFLGLGLQDRVPDAKTVWLYREALAQAGAADALFAAFDAHLKQNGYLAMGGQIVDATIVPAPKSRNTREENEAIKAGEMPKDWENQPAKRRQKDRDARWTKKHGRSHYGYKNHLSIDRRHKLVRRYTVTDAARHDSQEFDAVLDRANTGRDVWGDSAYRSAETEARLEEERFRSRIHRRASRNHGLTEREEQGNKTRSKIRARVEHVFGHMVNAMGGKLVRTIGIVRAKAKVGLSNLTYNMQRYTGLERRKEAVA